MKLGCGDCTNCSKQPGVSKVKRLNMSLKREDSPNSEKCKISDERNTEKLKILSVFDVGVANKSEVKIPDNVIFSENPTSPLDCLDLSGIVPLQVPATWPDEDGDVENLKCLPVP